MRPVRGDPLNSHAFIQITGVFFGQPWFFFSLKRCKEYFQNIEKYGSMLAWDLCVGTLWIPTLSSRLLLPVPPINSCELLFIDKSTAAVAVECIKRFEQVGLTIPRFPASFHENGSIDFHKDFKNNSFSLRPLQHYSLLLKAIAGSPSGASRFPCSSNPHMADSASPLQSPHKYIYCSKIPSFLEVNFICFDIYMCWFFFSEIF